MSREQDPRRNGWQQQAIGIIVVALVIFFLLLARYHRALLK